MGCKLNFIINGDEANPIPFETDLEQGQDSYEQIARWLINHNEERNKIKDKIKLLNDTKETSEEELNKPGFVPNYSLLQLKLKWNEFDWDQIEPSVAMNVKIHDVAWYKFFNEDVSNKIIISKNKGIEQKTFILNTQRGDKVGQLYSYLKSLSVIETLPDEQSDEYSSEQNYLIQMINSENSELYKSIQQLNDYIDSLSKSKEDRDKQIEMYENKEELSSKEQKILAQLKLNKITLENFEQYTPKNPRELVIDYINNFHKYNNLSVTYSGRSIVSTLETIKQILRGKNFKKNYYSDVFSIEMESFMNWDSRNKAYKIFSTNLIRAVELKKQDILMSDMDKTLQQNLIISINKFLDKDDKKSEDYKKIIEILIPILNDDFSNQFVKFEKGEIYLKGIPMSLKERYPNFTFDQLNKLELVEEYKGYNIYKTKDDQYLYDRHIITFDSFGKKHKSLDQVKNLIDNRIKYTPISKETLLQLKSLNGRNTVWTNTQYKVGQIIRSLNIPIDNLNIDLNEYEKSLIYVNNENDQNTLEKFYKYFEDKFTSNVSDDIRKKIDTAEKAACFVYLLTEKTGTTRNKKIDISIYNTVVNIIKEAKENYYIVESVSNALSPRKGMNLYSTIYKDQKTKVFNKEYITVLNPIEITNNNKTVNYDQTYNRLVPTIVLLKDLAQKIQDKLGIKVNILTQSDLEEKFKEWKEEMPDNILGFVKNGEIYINGSNADEKTLWHEFSHIMLAIIRNNNPDLYYNLLDFIANHDKAEYIRQQVEELYENKAQSDKNEEIFVRLFSNYMQGRFKNVELDTIFKEIKQGLSESLDKIFGKNKVTDDISNLDFYQVLGQFGYELGTLLEIGNGLDIEQGTKYRQVSNWIESQIRLNKDNENVGILEECN